MTATDFTIYTRDGVLPSLPQEPTIMALGTFDGVHTAHKQLLRGAIEQKKKLRAARVGAWCFAEAPASVLSGHKIPLLCTLERRIEIMLSMGLDFVAVGDFRSFCSMAAEDFVERVLCDRLSCVGTVCGFNHHFGHKGLGSPALLKRIFGEENAIVVPEVRLFSETVSSSAIRSHILSGNVAHASLMLGRPFTLEAQVVTGKALGRDLGFPTANQFFPKGTVTPRRGIYATLVETPDGKHYVGVSNVGIRPTIIDGSDSHAANCETYIHEFDGDLYGKTIKVSFCEYLREERKFASLDALRAQIDLDLHAAIGYFAEAEAPDIDY